jgi:hypothetical protein
VCSSRSDLPGSEKDNEVTAVMLTHGASEAFGVDLCGDTYQDGRATTSKKPLGLVPQTLRWPLA